MATFPPAWKCLVRDVGAGRDRCQQSLRLALSSGSSDSGKEELSVTAAEAEISYYPGSGLELADVLQEQVLLAVPLKIVCKPDCKGLCPSCGRNRNLETCDCAEKTKTPDGRDCRIFASNSRFDIHEI